MADRFSVRNHADTQGHSVALVDNGDGRRPERVDLVGGELSRSARRRRRVLISAQRLVACFNHHNDRSFARCPA